MCGAWRRSPADGAHVADSIERLAAEADHYGDGVSFQRRGRVHRQPLAAGREVLHGTRTRRQSACGSGGASEHDGHTMALLGLSALGGCNEARATGQDGGREE